MSAPLWKNTLPPPLLLPIQEAPFSGLWNGLIRNLTSRRRLESRFLLLVGAPGGELTDRNRPETDRFDASVRAEL
jgi:hypothetical protein